MLREYELRGDMLVCYITDKHWFKNPHLIIRVNVRTLDFSVRNLKPAYNRGYILDEIRRLWSLLESPHWRNLVGLQCVHNHPDTYGPLF